MSVRAAIAALAEGERVIDGELAHYLARVLRLRPGARFVAFDPTGPVEADAVVLATTGHTVTVKLSAVRAPHLTAHRPISWIHGLAKGEKSDLIVRDLTELGATLFVAAVTSRSVVHLEAARASARRARWQRIATEAARQCGRADVPNVVGPCAWATALGLSLPEAARFCLHASAQRPLAPALERALRAGASLTFATGPEGGLSDAEIAAAVDAGFDVVSLGPFVLRTETVPAAVLGAVRLLEAMLGFR